MTVKKTIAKTLAKVSLDMAKVSCGTASLVGAYQPKEPKKLLEL